MFPSHEGYVFFVAASRTALAGLQSTATDLPNTDYKTEVLNSLLSIPTHVHICTQLQIKTNKDFQTGLDGYECHGLCGGAVAEWS